MNDLYPWSLCGGKVVDDMWVYFLLVFLVLVLIFKVAYWVVHWELFLWGVCGNISSPLSKNIMEGTDCAKLFVPHFNWCILERTC